jgi:hypothetical protein
MRGVVLTFLLLLAGSNARADSTRVDSTLPPDTVGRTAPRVDVDTVLYRPGYVLTPYTPVTDSVNLERHLFQKPTVALFKSALIPGWGQLGNRRYIKAVFFAGLDAWLVGSAIHYARQASDYRKKFEESADISDRNDHYDLYQDRKDERNKFTWFAVITAFVAMFDAYVDAHLSGFPRREQIEITVGCRPDQHSETYACLSVSF